MIRQLFSGLALSACLLAPAAFGQDAASGTKVAIINVRDAVTRTDEGQNRLTQLQESYRPRGAALQKRAQEVETLRAQLRQGENTMSEEAQRKLVRDIQQKERDLQRENEDLEAEFNQEQQVVLNDVFGKLKAVIQKYTREQGYSIVLDISSPQSPVVDASNELDITAAVIELYNQEYPAQAASAASEPSAAAQPVQ